LIKAEAFKIKARVNYDFYDWGKISGENRRRKIGSFYPKVFKKESLSMKHIFNQWYTFLAIIKTG
jgi:hypothetical protein